MAGLPGRVPAPIAIASPRAAPTALHGGQQHAGDRERHAGELQPASDAPRRRSPTEGIRALVAGDRRHHAHRADRQRLVEGARPPRCRRPPTSTGHKSPSPIQGRPASTTRTAAPARPTTWPPTTTAQSVARRVVSPPRKSADPHETDAARAGRPSMAGGYQMSCLRRSSRPVSRPPCRPLDLAARWRLCSVLSGRFPNYSFEEGTPTTL